MPKRCVVGGCSNVSGEHVSLFLFPKDDQQRQEWTHQVQRTRPEWAGPSPTSFVCSAHFSSECFDTLPSLKESLGFKQRIKRVLLPKSIPTILPIKREGDTHTDRLSGKHRLDRKRVSTSISNDVINLKYIISYIILIIQSALHFHLNL